MMLRRLFMIALVVFLSSATASSAQYLFLDVNGDGMSSATDQISSHLPVSVDVWLQTDANRDGSRAVCSRWDPAPLTMFSYEFILHPTGGTVEWGAYTNLQPLMTYCLGEFRGKTDFYAGFSDSPVLAPGRYKLGTLMVKVLSGAPRLEFTSRSKEFWWAQTSFGSMNPGKEGLNTLIYSDDPTLVTEAGVPGDWSDADGVQMASVNLTAKEPVATIRYIFGVSVSPNPMNPSASIAVSTSRAGFLRVRLFDVRGRLVKTLMDQSMIAEGIHKMGLTSSNGGVDKLASGVYFYRVEAEEGMLSGRLVVAK